MVAVEFLLCRFTVVSPLPPALPPAELVEEEYCLNPTDEALPSGSARRTASTTAGFPLPHNKTVQEKRFT